MLQLTLSYALHNFPLVMLILAILIPMFSKERFKIKLCWAMFLFPVGFVGIWGFIIHGFHNSTVAQNICWQQRQFQFEIALVNLTLGITGIIASLSSKQYRYAVATMVTILYWGSAIGYINQLITIHSTHAGNISSSIFTDIITPIILWVSVFMVPQRLHEESGYIV